MYSRIQLSLGCSSSYFQWMQQLWGTNKDCYVRKHNVDPESICSILIYLSEVCKTSRYKLSWMLFTDNKSSDTCKNYVSPIQCLKATSY